MADKSQIRSRYTKKDRFITESGRPVHNEYQIKIDDNGHKTLSKVGETNLYEKIQAALEGTLISTILEQCEYKSEEERMQVLNKRVGQYVNLEELPQNLREAQQAIITIKNEFYQLPTEIRAQFDNSPEKYVQDYGTESWMNVLYPKGDEIKLEEPIKTESEVVKNE